MESKEEIQYYSRQGANLAAIIDRCMVEIFIHRNKDAKNINFLEDIKEFYKDTDADKYMEERTLLLKWLDLTVSSVKDVLPPISCVETSKVDDMPSIFEIRTSEGEVVSRIETDLGMITTLDRINCIISKEIQSDTETCYNKLFNLACKTTVYFLKLFIMFERGVDIRDESALEAFNDSLDLGDMDTYNELIKTLNWFRDNLKENLKDHNIQNRLNNGEEFVVDTEALEGENGILNATILEFIEFINKSFEPEKSLEFYNRFLDLLTDIQDEMPDEE